MLDRLRADVLDTGFWIAAFTPSDENHKDAAGYLEDLRTRAILMPWPIMYEVLRTKTVKSDFMMSALKRVLSWKVVRLNDVKYRRGCLAATISQQRGRSRGISLVDMVVRAVLADEKLRIKRLFTFNAGDFADVCHPRGIAISPAAR